MTLAIQEVPRCGATAGRVWNTAGGEMRCGACGVAVSRLKRPK
jgi:hypothetical protein